MLTILFSYNWQKFNNKMNKNIKREYENVDPEYVTWQIKSNTQELLLRLFCCLIFALFRKS